MLPGALAHFALRIAQGVDAAPHRLLIGPVVQMGQGSAESGPAIRFAGEKRELRA